MKLQVHMGWTRLFMMLLTVELSVWMGVGAWECSVSSNLLRILTPLNALRKNAHSSAPVVEYMTALMLLERLCHYWAEMAG